MDLSRFHVVSAHPLGDRRVRLSFRDGTEKEVDLTSFLAGPVFERVRNDKGVFESMVIEGGTICWETGADIDTIVLYFGSQEEAERHLSHKADQATV